MAPSPTLDDVYLKFGFASEAAQLLETELGNLLLLAGMADEGLLSDRVRAAALFDSVNRKTLGQLLKSLNRSDEPIACLEVVLSRALKERNRLSHSFYREHNYRRNSAEGRAIMLLDLEAIHVALIDAFKAVHLLSGVDLDKLSADDLPTRHVPI